MSTTIIATVIAGLIVAVIIAMTSWGRDRLARLFHRNRPWPRVAMRFVPLPSGRFRSTERFAPTAAGEEYLELQGRWRVTAVGDATASVVRATVRIRRRNVEASLTVWISRGGVDEDPCQASSTPIGMDSTHKAVDLQLTATVEPPPKGEGPYKTTVTFVDSYGNRYKQRVTFPRMRYD